MPTANGYRAEAEFVVDGKEIFRKMIEALKIGHYDGAAKEIRESKAAKQTGNRYERLAYYMERGEW